MRGHQPHIRAGPALLGLVGRPRQGTAPTGGSILPNPRRTHATVARRLHVGKQRKPTAWLTLPPPALADAVYTWTKVTVAALVAQHTPPAAVQIGNEVTHGFLWPNKTLSQVSGGGGKRTHQHGYSRRLRTPPCVLTAAARRFPPPVSPAAEMLGRRSAALRRRPRGGLERVRVAGRSRYSRRPRGAASTPGKG